MREVRVPGHVPKQETRRGRRERVKHPHVAGFRLMPMEQSVQQRDLGEKHDEPVLQRLEALEGDLEPESRAVP